MRIDKYRKEVTLSFRETAIGVIVFVLPVVGMFISMLLGE